MIDIDSNTFLRFKPKSEDKIEAKLNQRFKPKSTGKKAQVTIFIILGILLVLALILILAFKEEIVTFKPGELIPTSKGKVEQFISACIETAGNDAVEKVGIQGGYITIPNDIASDTSRHLQTSPFTQVPYWAYGATVDIPSLDEIKQQIDQYVETHVRDCLLQTEAFQETYTLIEKSPIQADTNIVNNKVIFNVRWNVEIRNQIGDVITELIEHSAESPIKLKKAYDTSVQIVQQEMQTLKLEDITQDLIALEHPNVPVAGMELQCRPKTWQVSTVKSTLQDLLRINLRQLKVKGTEFVEFPEEFPYYQNHYVWDMGDEFSQSDISVTFNYDNNYPFQFQVTPVKGNTMSSNMLGGGSLLSYLCVQNWKFTYDVVYPVLVKVRDDSTGYIFMTGMTVHLIRNMPNRGSFVMARPSNSLDFATDEKYCSDARVPMTVLTWEKVQNDAQGIYDTEPLSNVNVSLTCLKYRCEMGKTTFNFAQSGYQSGLSLNFPHCVGGIMRGEKNGYKEDWKRVVTEAGSQVDLYLTPLLKVPLPTFKVVKYAMDQPTTTPPQPLAADETALVQLTLRKPDDLPDTPFHQSTFTVSESLDSRLAEQQNVELLAKADFTYELKIDLFDERKFIGGYRANWTVPWEQLQSVQEITFPVISTDGSEEAAFNLLTGLPQKSTLLPEPEIKTTVTIT